MTQNTYIGQAQINTQVEDAPYKVGDIVTWKSSRSDRSYLVRGFDGKKVILTALDPHTWSPQASWFVKDDTVIVNG